MRFHMAFLEQNHKITSFGFPIGPTDLVVISICMPGSGLPASEIVCLYILAIHILQPYPTISTCILFRYEWVDRRQTSLAISRCNVTHIEAYARANYLSVRIFFGAWLTPVIILTLRFCANAYTELFILFSTCLLSSLLAPNEHR
jgi:hypothetical protein